VKILVLTNLFPPHHAGTFDLRCQSVTEILQQRGHEIRVLTSNHGMTTEQQDNQIARRLRLNGAFGHRAISSLGELTNLEKHNHQVLRETVSEFKPDLIHVYSLEGLSKSLTFTLRNCQLPTVFDVTDQWLSLGIRNDAWLRWWNQDPAPLLRRSVRALLELAGQRVRLDATAPTRMMKGYDRLPKVFGKADPSEEIEPNSIAGFRFERLYFCSDFLKRRTEEAGFQVSHGEVIYPGIRTEQFVGDIKPKSAPIAKFLIVTQLDADSGVMTALEALRQARENQIAAKINICGRGDSEYIAKLRSLVVRHQLPVEFLTVSNPQKDMPGVYRQHDAFIYTSEWDEPFAVAPLEAMAAGLPVIGAKSGGARELFRNGDNAWVYTPGDSLELASRIQEIQMQPVLRHQMAENAQMEALSKFNETIVADQIENYLNNSLEFWQRN